MRKLTKALALILSLALILTFPVGASAVEPNDPTENVLIDENRTGSLTIYKVDLTNAEKDGVWDSSYVSTGIYDQDVYDTPIGATVTSFALRDGSLWQKSWHRSTAESTAIPKWRPCW